MVHNRKSNWVVFMSIKQILQIGAMIFLMVVFSGLLCIKTYKLQIELTDLKDRMGEIEYCVHDLDRHRP